MIKLEVIGNIGNDAEVKDFNGRKAVSFSVAHSEKFTNQQGQTTTRTQWVDVLMNGDGGGLLPYLKKGTKVFVRGNIKVNVYQSQANGWMASINMSASEVQLCGLKGNEETPF